jgi:hypothetical protein
MRACIQRVAPLLLALASACAAAEPPAREIPYMAHPPVLDGRADEPEWALSPWRELRYTLVGEPATEAADFSGRYRLLWREQALYLLAEIRDDVLSDGEPDPLLNYWADDALEILIDEDASGGDHETNHGAFAYHVALDGQVVDIDTDGHPALFNDHVQAVWRRSPEPPYALIWEVRIQVYPDPATLPEGASWQPRRLAAGDVLGFALAWCDSDAPGVRTRLVADVDVAAVNGDRNRLYRDAGTFARIRLQAAGAPPP